MIGVFEQNELESAITTQLVNKSFKSIIEKTRDIDRGLDSNASSANPSLGSGDISNEDRNPFQA